MNGRPQTTTPTESPPAAFYCVASGEYFLGAVAMINSLRLLGHDEPIHLLDCGLSAAQRDSIAAEATVMRAPDSRDPHQLKTVLPIERPAATAVLIDSDLIVTRPLTPLIEAASPDRIIAFRNHADRFLPEWGELLGLGQLRRSPYVCSGLVALGGATGRDVIGSLDRLQRLVDIDRSCFAAHDDSYALLYADQDVLNAILASARCAGRVDALDARLAPMVPFDGLSVIDATRLRCSYADGTEPYAVHHSLSPKPWQRPGYGGVYTTLLRRLLESNDVAIPVRRELLPADLRRGVIGSASRLRAKARDQLAWRLGASPPG